MALQNPTTAVGENRWDVQRIVFTKLKHFQISIHSINSSTKQIECTSKKLELLNNDVDEVVEIMNENMVRIVERGHNLRELDQRAVALNETAQQFQGVSVKLRRKRWLANMKIKIVCGVVVVVLIVIVVGEKKFFFSILLCKRWINRRIFYSDFSLDCLWMNAAL